MFTAPDYPAPFRTTGLLVASFFRDLLYSIDMGDHYTVELMENKHAEWYWIVLVNQKEEAETCEMRGLHVDLDSRNERETLLKIFREIIAQTSNKAEGPVRDIAIKLRKSTSQFVAKDEKFS